VYSRYYGSVTGDDMRRHIEEVCKDDRFEQHRYNILDFSDATDFNPTERELLTCRRFDETRALHRRTVA